MSKEKANERINSKIAVPQKARRSGSIIMLMAAFLVIVLLGGVIIYLVSGKESESYNQVVTPENVEQLIAELDQSEIVSPGSYEVIMNKDWVFPDASSPSTNAVVENSITNTNMVNFTIALADQSEKIIYTSPYLEVGSILQEIKLDDETLSAGTYNAVLTYHLVDEEFQEISTVSVSITIIIQQ